MKILITGGAGFIGSHIADHFVEEGYDVHVLDNLYSGNADNISPRVIFHQMDLRDESLASLFKVEKFPIVIHHAAQLDVRKSVADPVFDADVNVGGFLNLMEAGRKNGLQRIVFASTGGAIYGDSESLPQTETSPLQPESPYGITKLASEKYLYFYERVYGISSVVLRYANVYGPRQGTYGEAGVIAIFIQKMLKGEAPHIFGSGLQTRDYVFVGDVVQANHLAVQAVESGIYNIGTGVETDVKTLLSKIQKQLKTSFNPVHIDSRPGEVLRSALSYTKIEKAMGWRPKVDLDTGLQLTVDWFNSRI